MNNQLLDKRISKIEVRMAEVENRIEQLIKNTEELSERVKKPIF